MPIPWGPTLAPRFLFGFSNCYDISPPAVRCQSSLDTPSCLISEQNSLANGLNPTPAPAVGWSDPAVASVGQHGGAIAPAVELMSVDLSDESRDVSSEVSGQPLDLNCCIQYLQNVNISSKAKCWNRTLLEDMSALVQVMSPKGVIVCTSSSHQTLGYGTSDLIGESLDVIYQPSDVAVLMREFTKAEALESNLTLRLKARSGQYMWFQGTCSIQTDSGRRWVTTTLLQQPIAPLSNRALRSADERSRKHGFWVSLSTSGLVLHLFGDPRKPLGIPAEDLVGTTLQDLIQQDEARTKFENLLTRAHEGAVVSSTLTLLSGRGHRLEASVVVYPGPLGDRRRPYYLLAHCSILRPPDRRHKASSKKAPSPLPGGGDDDDDDVLRGLDTEGCGPLIYEIHRLRAANRDLHKELETLQKRDTPRRRFRRHGGDPAQGCANCHTKVSPEWRRGPGGLRNLCNRCGLRWAKTRAVGGI
ncbi:putative white collar 1 protein [Apiospora phragmitis]|uniref:White collar 1 protein n=1 Tax=Apiospora phragmitis TaxID=2905665 RepID=A0ABR1VXN2_9PEZI